METIAPVDYSLFARRIEVNDEHSSIIESQPLNSSSETTTFVYMAGTPEKWPDNLKSRLVSKENNSI